MSGIAENVLAGELNAIPKVHIDEGVIERYIDENRFCNERVHTLKKTQNGRGLVVI